MLLVLLPMAPLMMPLMPPNRLVVLPPLGLLVAVVALLLLLLYREVRGILWKANKSVVVSGVSLKVLYGHRGW